MAKQSINISDNKNYLLLGGGVLLLIFILAMVFGGGGQFNWNETYDEKSAEPFGTYVLYNMLESYFEGEKMTVIDKNIDLVLPWKDTSKVVSNYVFIGPAMFMDSMETQSLLHYVEKGNKAFISCKSIPYDLMFYIYYEECNDYYWDDFLTIKDTTASFNFLHPALASDTAIVFDSFKEFKINEYDWNYVPDEAMCEEEHSMISLGKMNDYYTNFVKKKYGKGEFYLHTTPLALSNFHLIDEQGKAYADRVFSHLTAGPIYWDKESRIKENISRKRNEMNSLRNNRSFNSDGPLKYVLSQPALRWAWYLTLGLTLFYLLFRAKRRQRMIPVTEENRNTSLDYISTIGSLYFLQNDHRQLALQEMDLFLNFIRERYHLHTKVLDSDFVTQLSQRSEIPRTEVEGLVRLHQNINGATNIHDFTLVTFHQKMETFYERCK